MIISLLCDIGDEKQNARHPEPYQSDVPIVFEEGGNQFPEVVGLADEGEDVTGHPSHGERVVAGVDQVGQQCDGVDCEEVYIPDGSERAAFNEREGEDQQQEIGGVEDADGGGIEPEPLPENGTGEKGECIVVEPEEDETCEKEQGHQHKKSADQHNQRGTGRVPFHFCFFCFLPFFDSWS